MSLRHKSGDLISRSMKTVSTECGFPAFLKTLLPNTCGSAPITVLVKVVVLVQSSSTKFDDAVSRQTVNYNSKILSQWASGWYFKSTTPESSLKQLSHLSVWYKCSTVPSHKNLSEFPASKFRTILRKGGRIWSVQTAVMSPQFIHLGILWGFLCLCVSKIITITNARWAQEKHVSLVSRLSCLLRLRKKIPKSRSVMRRIGTCLSCRELHNRKTCKHLRATSLKCGNVGHISKISKSKSIHYTTVLEESSDISCSDENGKECINNRYSRAFSFLCCRVFL